MTNDYLFRMVLQRDKETLIMLICSVLHLCRDQVIDVNIENPIEPGATISDKEYQLDILVKLNGNVAINLEIRSYVILDFFQHSTFFRKCLYQRLYATWSLPFISKLGDLSSRTRPAACIFEILTKSIKSFLNFQITIPYFMI